MATLDLTEIVKAFKDVTILREISLQVLDGEFVVLLGPSGCGKSTLLRIIAGLEQQTSGCVSIGGVVVNDLSPRDRDIAMVFQQYALYPHLTVRENLAFGLKMRKEAQSSIESRIKEAADLLEIHQLLNRFPKDLSGGQRQRVAMGRAIVRKPKLFLFDEPLSNLDARLRTSLRIELKNLHRQLGTTMVYVTHDQVEAMTLGQKIVILDQGRIQQIGTPEQIYKEPHNPFVAGFIGNPPMNILKGILEIDEGVQRFKAGKLTLAMPFLSSNNGVSHAYLGIRPEDIQLEPVHSPMVHIIGTIELIENLGADTLLHITSQGQRLTVRTSPLRSKNVGESIPIYLPVDRLHMFADNERLDCFSN